MIGVFDSGVGGLSALNELRRLLPTSDLIYLADRKNAPYGTKTREELMGLIKNDVNRLRDMGADKILSACCTASTVVPLLDEETRRDVLPIIHPAAKVAARLSRVTVIATDHTVRSSAFESEIRRISPETSVQEIPCQQLVAYVEEGSRDGEVTEECIELLSGVARSAKDHRSEGIILGCTHFSHLEKTIKNLLPDLEIINSALLGARALALSAKNDVGSGKTIYTE